MAAGKEQRGQRVKVEEKGRHAKGRGCNSLPENKSNKRKNQRQSNAQWVKLVIIIE